MSTNRGFFALFHLFVAGILIGCILVPAANALTLGGSKQMLVNGTQTLTASGGSGDYTWSLAGGAGEIIGDGDSITFRAPHENPNCANNPTVCVTDSSGQQECIGIAVNAYNGTAYKIKTCGAEHICYQMDPAKLPYWYPPTYNEQCSVVKIYLFSCDGSSVYLQRCGGSGRNTFDDCSYSMCDTIQRKSCEAAAVATGDPDDCNYSGNFPEPLGVPHDLRTESQKAAGCCPAAFAGKPGDNNGGTNDTGKSCPINIPAQSSANLKSGNLYHSQDVGVLSLSYNSIDTINGSLGKKWTHQYNQQITASGGGSTLSLKTEDGNIIYFRLSGGIYYPDNVSGDTSRIVKNADGTYTRTTKDMTNYSYNASGRLAAVIDKNGNATTLTYSGGSLTGITDQNSRTTILTTTSGLITGITDALGRSHTLSYAGGLLASIADPLGNTWIYTYDSAGRMLTKKDPANNTVTYTYNASGKILSSTDPEGKTRTMDYPASGTTKFVEKDGGVWTYKYNPVLAVKTEQTDPLGNITRYTYDNKRNLISTIAPDGGTITYTYDANRNMTSMTDPSGNVTQYTYNSLNLVAAITDPKGGVTTYAYDTKGNLTGSTDPLGAVTSFQYDAKGNIIAMTDAGSKTTSFTYDAQNNLIAITDPLNKTTTFTYDAVGNRLSTTDPQGNTTRYAYTALNQMIQVTDARGYKTNYTYDYRGNILKAVNAKGNATTYTYNYKGNVTQINDALNNITKMAYGPSTCGSGCGGAEKLTALTDALNHTTAYTYDAAGRLIKETDPQERIMSYEYDAGGKMIARTKPDGRTINYYYDAAGRLIERRYPDNTVVKFQYDQNGNLLAATNAWIAYYYSYDAGNRMTGVVDSNLRNIEYRYDLLGNKTSMTNPEGFKTTYTYDAGRKLTGIGNYTGNYRFAYDAVGRRTQLDYPNGITTSYVYDPNGNLTQIKHTLGHKPVTYIKYNYDPINNRLNRAEDGKAANYRYDAISRLINAGHREAYTYDGVGNRLTGPESKESYAYTTGNELKSDRMHDYEYDPNGNLIKKTEVGHNNHHKKVTSYAYDDENRLVQVKIQRHDKAKIVSFVYDPFDRRISKTVHREDFDDVDDETGEDRNKRSKDRHHKKDCPRTTHYLYDNQAIIAEYNDQGKLTASYTHGLGIDEPLAGDIHHEGRIYYHADAVGSIIALTSNHGHKIQDYEYDSFGNMKSHHRWINQPFTYTAREYDTETGLYYYRARYYDPQAGRFITKDPIGLRGGINRYAYVSNNPINAIDPWGLFSNHLYLALQAFGQVPCPKLYGAAANAAQDVDARGDTNDVANVAWHAMSKGRIGESTATAATNTQNYINKQLSDCNATGLGNALHAEQDKYAGGHRGYQPWYGDAIPSYAHWRADTFDSDTQGAIYASINLIKRFKEKCPCACQE